MRVVRRHRRAILVVLTLLGLASITYGFLRRVGLVSPPRERSHVEEGGRDSE